MKQIIYETRRFKKYEMEDIFEKDKFIETSEETFDQMVVKYRNQWTMNYKDGYQEFTDTTGFRFRRYYA